jgi:uncharacterized membrane protein YbhN (UPF0104 family)
VDGIAMLLLATSGLISSRFGLLALLAVAAAAVACLGVLHARPLVHSGLRLLQRSPRLARLATLVATAYDSARELLTWPRLVGAIGVGVLSWGGECLALYLILLGLGAEPSLQLVNNATFALAAGSLVGSASLLPGGIGAAEGTVAAVLDLVAGQPREVAAAATLLIRACTLWFGVALGAAALIRLSARVMRRASSGARP